MLRGGKWLHFTSAGDGFDSIAADRYCGTASNKASFSVKGKVFLGLLEVTLFDRSHYIRKSLSLIKHIDNES